MGKKKMNSNLIPLLGISLCTLTLVAADVPDLIPDTTPNTTTPNYVCTWSWQDWRASRRINGKRMSGRDALQLLGENGWVKTLFTNIRHGLIFLLDDGWDQPFKKTSNLGSLELNEKKFPNYGSTPAERLENIGQKHQRSRMAWCWCLDLRPRKVLGKGEKAIGIL